MSILLSLPPEERAKRLARMGMTEDEYRASLEADAPDQKTPGITGNPKFLDDPGLNFEPEKQ